MSSGPGVGVAVGDGGGGTGVRATVGEIVGVTVTVSVIVAVISSGGIRPSAAAVRRAEMVACISGSTVGVCKDWVAEGSGDGVDSEVAVVKGVIVTGRGVSVVNWALILASTG